MAPRKRHAGNQNGRHGNERENNASQKSSAQEVTRTSGVKRFLAASVASLLIIVAGVYLYNSPDARDAIERRLSDFLPTEYMSQPQRQEEEQQHQQQQPSSAQQKKLQPRQQEAESALPKRKPPIIPEASLKQSFATEAITNAADSKIRRRLEVASSKLDKGRFSEALAAFDAILAQHPLSPLARYGRAQSLDKLSEEQHSNTLLEQCIEEYNTLLKLDNVPKELVIIAGKRCAERMTFRGWALEASKKLQTLIKRYPDSASLHNQLGIAFLISGQPNSALSVFKKVLNMYPDDGVALVHYGYILKTTHKDIPASIDYLQRGLDTGSPGTMDGRFVFQLGDAYYRNGQQNKSMDIYKMGAEHGVFLSRWQRSLYNVDRLTARPIWTLEQTTIAQKLLNLAKHWKTIRDEGMAQLTAEGGFVREDENLRESGMWKQLTLFSRGRKHANTCALTPKTCQLMEQIPEATKCKRGQVKFSVMHPGTRVWPHSGPTNCRIRAHLGLVVPEGPHIRITDKIRTWKEGEFLIFDDSFQHDVWHDGKTVRLVLIVDIWHPELTAQERQTLPAI